MNILRRWFRATKEADTGAAAQLAMNQRIRVTVECEPSLYWSAASRKKQLGFPQMIEAVPDTPARQN